MSSEIEFHTTPLTLADMIYLSRANGSPTDYESIFRLLVHRSNADPDVLLEMTMPELSELWKRFMEAARTSAKLQDLGNAWNAE